MFLWDCASDDQEANGHEKVEGGTSMLPVNSSAPIKCHLGSRPCKSEVECVNYNHICDGEVDCKDGSDEEECLLTCEKGKLLDLFW